MVTRFLNVTHDQKFNETPHNQEFLDAIDKFLEELDRQENDESSPSNQETASEDRLA